jgi:flagellar biosynthesis/type III secretory pathway ATPase
VAGTNPIVDRAVRRLPAIHAFLRQRPGEATPFGDTVTALKLIADEQG